MDGRTGGGVPERRETEVEGEEGGVKELSVRAERRHHHQQEAEEHRPHSQPVRLQACPLVQRPGWAPGGASRAQGQISLGPAPLNPNGPSL